MEIAAHVRHILQRCRWASLFGVLTAVLGLTSAVSMAGPPVKLNGSVPAGSKIVVDRGRGFGPDGSRVFYRVESATGISDLFSVPSDGGVAVKLNRPSSAGLYAGLFGTSYFSVSPDSDQVYYLSGTRGSEGLFAAPSEGGLSVNLSGALAAGEQPLIFDVSADGSRLAYYVYNQSAVVGNLFSVPATGGPPTPLITARIVTGSLEISRDGNSVNYRIQGGNGLDTMFNLSALDGTTTRLFGPVAFKASGQSPDGSTLAYAAASNYNAAFEYYTVPTGGGQPVQVSAWGSGTQNSQFWTGFSGDGSRVLYQTDQETPGRYDLYSVPSAGGTPVKLNGAQGVSPASPTPSPDGAWVLYSSAPDVGFYGDLYIASIDGGSPHRVHGPSDPLGKFYGDVFTPDGSRVIYVRRGDSSAPSEVFSVPSEGGTPVKLNGALVDGGNAVAPLVNSDGSRVIYLGNQESKDYYGLYIVPTAGGTPVKVSAGLPLHSTGALSSDGNRVLMETRIPSLPSAPNELYSRLLRERWIGGAGDWDAAANWDQGEMPDDVMQVAIEGSSSVVASGASVNRAVNELRLGGGAETSMLTLQSDAAITAINGVVIESNGVLGGNGSIVGDLKNLGSVSPETSPGMLSISGSFSQTADGILDIDIAGSASFDKLQVIGPAMLGGDLNISLLDYVPALGDEFPILTASGGVSGRFASLQLPNLSGGLHFNVIYAPTHVALTVSALPEPKGVTTVAFATVALAWQLHGTSRPESSRRRLRILAKKGGR